MNFKFLYVFKQKLYLFALIISCFVGFFSYFILSQTLFLVDYQFAFSFILLFICLALSVLMFLVSKLFFFLLREIKLKKAGKELHKKIVFIFAIVTLVPTLIVAGFSVLIFDTALKGWFNPRISTAVSQSVKVANQYLLEHQNAMRGDILELANLLNVNANKLSSNKKKINIFLNDYTRKHNLSEALLIDSSGNVLAFSEFVFEYSYAEIPQEYYNSINFNKIIITKEEDSNKMRAFMKLSQYIDAYLLISRFVDQRVLDAIESSSIAAEDYQSIKLDQFNFTISFVLIFLLLTLVLLLSSLLVGLNLANKLVDPISSLIKAAEEVGGGNLDYNITLEDLSNININELKRLGHAFNNMISDLKSNRIDLEQANDQLDKRRRFSESVLSGVYSGVIGLDENLKLNLPNLTAMKLLNISIDKHFGLPIIDLVPEFSNLITKLSKTDDNIIEDKVQLIRKDKVLNLITRIVVQKIDNKIFGFVLTFDDVTNLIAAQKIAAWSDIARRIAHEIKNPLTPIRLAAERLKKLLHKSSKLDVDIFEQSLNMITRQVDDIHYLVDEFSSFARMPSPIFNRLNISLIVKQYIEPLISSFKNVTIKIDQKIYKNIYIMADEKQIRQAIGNLLKNSYENITFNKVKNGKISVDFNYNSEFITIFIRDNGTGINESDMSKIMEPYFTTKSGGTGLGLAITKKIIEDHNGSILLKTSETKDGTSVIINFPIIKNNN